MICVYVAVGQKASTVANVAEALEKHGALDKTIIVAATAADAAPPAVPRSYGRRCYR